MIKVVELFSGIGAQAKALERLEIEHEIVATSDLDKDAIVSYAAIHNGLTLEMIENYPDYPSREDMADYLSKLNIGYDFKKNKPYDWNKLARRKSTILDHVLKSISKLQQGKNIVMPIEGYYLATIISKQVGDISKVEKLSKADLWTYSFPCQDISNAGLQKGFSKDSGTRSGLLWEVERLLNIAKGNGELPQYLLMENVKALVQQSFMPEFNKWLRVLESLGYKTYWEVLNAKDYGVPQNRERVFAVSFLEKRAFEFPEKIPLLLRLKDVLEQNVDEKYYLSDEVVNSLNLHLERNKAKGNGFGWKPTDGNCVANTVKTEGGYRPDTNFIIDRHSWDLVSVEQKERKAQKERFDIIANKVLQKLIGCNLIDVDNEGITLQKDNKIFKVLFVIDADDGFEPFITVKVVPNKKILKTMPLIHSAVGETSNSCEACCNITLFGDTSCIAKINIYSDSVGSDFGFYEGGTSISLKCDELNIDETLAQFSWDKWDEE